MNVSSVKTATVNTQARREGNGGRSGVLGLIGGLIVNGFGPISGAASIRNDVKEYNRSTGLKKTGHAVEIAGDLLNLSCAAALVAPPLAVGCAAAPLVKTAGELIVGK
jgi:hypothetical protein